MFYYVVVTHPNQIASCLTVKKSWLFLYKNSQNGQLEVASSLPATASVDVNGHQ